MSNESTQPVTNFGGGIDPVQTSEIVVTAYPIANIIWNTLYTTALGSSFYGYLGFSGSGAPTPAYQGTSTAGHHEVKTYLTNPNDQTVKSQVQAAAEKLALAIAKVDDAFSHADQGATIYTPSGAMTVGQLKALWDRVSFQVTDQKQVDFHNGGVGQIASDGRGGFNDVISLDAFNVRTGGTGGYDSPNYQDGEGLVGLILHELGHVVPNAKAQYDKGFGFYRSETGDSSGAGFSGSEYWVNNERWANQTEQNVSTVLGTNTGAYDAAVAATLIGQGSWENPSYIHEIHLGHQPNVVTP